MRTTYKIRIRETRIVTLEVGANIGYSKEQIIAHVERNKGGLSLRKQNLHDVDEGQFLHDDSGKEIGRYGGLHEGKPTREVLEILRDV